MNIEGFFSIIEASEAIKNEVFEFPSERDYIVEGFTPTLLFLNRVFHVII